MKAWLIRALSLYVFNVAVLLLIGLLMRGVAVGWNALWAAVVLTLATLALKPLLLKVFRSAASKSASRRSKLGEKGIQYLLVFAVALIIWVLTVIFSGVSIGGWFWGYVLPPVFLLIAWVIYDLVDDRIEAKTGQVIGSVTSRMRGKDAAAPASPSTPSKESKIGSNELADGLTPEQRRMLDEL
ncbi:MAG: hypothetical protein ACTIKT_14415 [Microbacterium sp.]